MREACIGSLAYSAGCGGEIAACHIGIFTDAEVLMRVAEVCPAAVAVVR